MDFHTALQEAFLSDPYNEEGVIEMPASMEMDGVAYSIDGNPFDSADLAARARTHEDYSRPDPVTLSWEGEPSGSYYIEVSSNALFLDDVRAFTASEAALDVYNLCIGTRYYWRVAPDRSGIEDGVVILTADGAEAASNG